jgi:hypothetical protein
LAGESQLKSSARFYVQMTVGLGQTYTHGHLSVYNRPNAFSHENKSTGPIDQPAVALLKGSTLRSACQTLGELAHATRAETSGFRSVLIVLASAILLISD